jgi:DNA-binding GntR family transcriptional regulator
VRDDDKGLVDKIVDALESAISNGELLPGKRISEVDLSSALGVSRGPLREAIRKMEARRLFKRTAFRGIRLVDLSIDDLEQLLVVREVLEGAAARAAAVNISAEELKQLKLFSEDGIRRKSSAPITLDKLQYGFHHMIARASKNRWLEEMLCKDLYGLLRAYRYSSANLAQRNEEAREEHHEIVKAIAQRDGDRAETLMRKHNRNGRISLIKRLRADFVPQGQSSLRRISRSNKARRNKSTH